MNQAGPQVAGTILRRLWRWSAILFAAVVLIAATMVGLFRLLVPMAPSYLRDIEQVASTALGARVEVSRVDLRWHLAGPALLLEGVTVTAEEDARVLARVGEVDLGFDAIGAIMGQGLTPSWARVRGLELELARADDGEILIAGGPLPARRSTGSSDGGIRDFDLDLESTTLTWRDPRAPVPELRLQGVRGHLELDGGDLEFAMQLPQPSREDADPIQMFGSWTRGGDDAGARISALATDLDLAVIGGLIPSPRLRLASGAGDMRLRVDLGGDGSLRSLETEVDLRGVSLVLVREDQERRIDATDIDGTVRWEQGVGGWRLSTRSLNISHDGRRHPPIDLTVDLIADGIRDRRLLNAQVASVPLDELARISWFADAEVADQVAAYAPAGQLQDLVLQLDLSGAQPVLDSLEGRFVDLAWSAVGKVPGAGGLDGSFQLSEGGGTLTLASRDIYFDAPEMFRERLGASQLSAQVSILRDGERLTVRATDLDLRNAHAHVTGRASIAALDADAGPDLDFELQLEDGDLAAKSAYLPVGIMPAAVVAWLDRGVVSGRVPRAEVTLRGVARSFPYRDGSGIFLIRFDYEDAVLDFADGWPIATGLAGEARFEGPGLEVTGTRGGWTGIALDGSAAQIPDLRRGQLHVSADASPDLGALMGFIASSPLRERFGAYLEAVRGEGDTAVNITLDMPLGDVDRFTLDGAVQLRGSAVSLGEGPVRVDALEGSVAFSRDAITGDGISGMLWDQPVMVRIAPDPEGGSQLSARGATPLTALPEDLRDEEIFGRLDGVLDWRLDASFPAAARRDAAPRQVVLRSDLVGLAVDLPQPFAKAALEGRDTVLTLAFPQPGSLETRLVQAGRVGVTARWQDADGWALERAHLRLGGGLPAMPADVGIWVSGRTEQVDADAWMGLMPTRGSGGASLVSLSLAVGDLAMSGQRYLDTRLHLDRIEQAWLLRLDGAEASGSVRIPDAGSVAIANAAPIVADFERLRLTSDGSDEVSDPRELRSLRLSAQELVVDGRSWGSVTLVADRIPAGLTVSEFRTQSPTHLITGSGGWIVDQDQHFSQLLFTADSTDVGETMQRFGLVQSLSAAQGHLEAQLRWQGALMRPAFAAMDGEARVSLADGQVEEVSPGAGRLFGLLSVGALQRRLRLDFSDLFGRGVAFDTITATYRVEQGDAYTDDLLMRGPGMDIGIAGRVGLAARDYDQQVLVNAKVGSALPIAGALAAGPAVGAALLVFSRLFRNELRDSTQVQYRVTGSWDDPVVQQVEAGTVAPTQGGAG